VAVHEFVAFLGLFGFGRIAADLPPGFPHGVIDEFQRRFHERQLHQSQRQRVLDQVGLPAAIGQFRRRGLGSGGGLSRRQSGKQRRQDHRQAIQVETAAAMHSGSP
jgi:hypothetical protein